MPFLTHLPTKHLNSVVFPNRKQYLLPPRWNGKWSLRPPSYLDQKA